ncbi:MAG: biotin transporter BioY, partial [Deinococcus sp.]
MTQISPRSPFPTLARAAFPQTGLTRDLLLVLGGAALVALAAQLELPLRPVPLTLQTLAVLLLGAALGSRRGALSLLSYLDAAALGLPVLSSGAGGLARLLGPTGGYLLGFMLAAGLVGWLVQRFGLDRSAAGTALAMLAGNVLIYLPGLAWLAHVTGLHGGALLGAGLLPFLLG